MAANSGARERSVEPWMSGTLGDLHPLMAALLYSFQYARADLEAWTEDLSAEDLSRSVLGLAPICFHIRHIAGSIDRLLTYARGEQLSAAQMSVLRDEGGTGMSREALLKLLDDEFERAGATIRKLVPESLGEMREIGRKRIPVPLATLLVHIAEHTQRHVGEAIVTAKALLHAR
jgi:uncharacterized damage-inducible protein DinB